MAGIVMLVEDDQGMRDSLEYMLRSNGYDVRTYANATELIDDYDPHCHGCLVVDLKLPSMSGLDLQQHLQKKGGNHPFLVITGHGDIPTAVEAMKVGAVDFLEKPFDESVFLSRVNQALRKDALNRDRKSANSDVEDRFNSLTPRERQVMELVVDGMLTKQIARQLGISTKTVEVHRSHVTKKMHVQSVAQLVKLVTEYRVANQDQRADNSRDVDERSA